MRLGILGAVCILTLGLGATARAEILPGTEVAIYPGEEVGEVVFDATELKRVLPVSEEPLKFETFWELFWYLEKTINAQPVFDEKGELVGVRGEATIYDEPCVPDDNTGTCIPAESAMMAFLGGKSGKILVGDEVLCVDPQKCEGEATLGRSATIAQGLAPMAAATASSQEFRISGRSFATGTWYREVGTRTSQYVGGYKAFERVCEWWLFFTYCWETTGWNNLRTQSFYTDKRGNLTSPPRIRWCHNCTKVSHLAWGITFELPVPEESPWTLHGSYGWHYGEGTGGKDDMLTCTQTGCIYGP